MLTRKAALMKEDLANIIWPDTSGLRDKEHWERNNALVRQLTEACIVIEWLRGRPGADAYLGMPLRYVLESAKDVVIEFLPCWNFYKIDDFSFDLPGSWEEVTRAVEAISTLKRLGMRK